eukprot:4300081-Amphidinium_carterae.1
MDRTGSCTVLCSTGGAARGVWLLSCLYDTGTERAEGAGGWELVGFPRKDVGTPGPCCNMPAANDRTEASPGSNGGMLVKVDP